MLAVVDAREQRRGFAAVVRGLRKLVAAQMEVAQVEAHLAGGTHVAQRHELVPRRFGTRSRERVLPEHRQRHDLGHLRLGRVMGLAETAEDSGREIEARGRLGHLAAGEARDAGGPVGQRLDLAHRLRLNRARRVRDAKAAQRIGRLGRALRFAAPGGVAEVLQLPG